MGRTNSPVTTRVVDVAILDLVNDLTGVLLRLLRGVGVGDVGLKVWVCQGTHMPGKVGWSTYLVAANNVAEVLVRRHVVEEYAEGRFECDGLWKRLLRRRRGSLPGLYTLQEIEEMTSWVGCCDAISVKRRFVRGPKRKL